jgi:hypothetical protein
VQGFFNEPTKVGGKREASSNAGAKGLGRSSKPKLGASGKMSDEQYQKDMAEKLLSYTVNKASQ